jgi:hypothetical protein
MKCIKKIKELFSVSSRIAVLESELSEIELNIKNTIDINLKQLRTLLNDEFKACEAKIQKMTFDYTANLEDTKSQYLKRYVEVRMDCMQQELSQIPLKIAAIQGDMNKLLTRQEDNVK